ncbi:MAG: MFS transporter [Coriobacteriales bacterium]
MVENAQSEPAAAAGGAQRSYRALFCAPGVLRLVPAMVLARLPIGATAVLLVLFVSLRHGAAVAGLTSAGLTLGTALVAPAWGKLVDRGRGPVALVSTAAAQALLMCALVASCAWGLPAPVTVAAAVLAGALTPPVAGTTRALWPQLVPRGLLDVAYNFEVLVIDVLYVTGPLMASIFIAAGVSQWGLLFVVAGQLLGCIMLACSREVRLFAEKRRGAGAASAGECGAARADGAPAARGSLLAQPAIALLLLTILLTNGLSGALETLLPLWYSAQGNAAGSSLAISLWSIGSIISVLAFVKIQPSRERMPLPRQLLLFSAVYLGVSLLLNVGGGGAALLAIVFGIGLAVSPCTNLHYQLSGELAPQSRHAEMFSWVNTATSAGISLGAFLMGLAVEGPGFEAAFLLPSLFVAVAMVAITGLLLVLLRSSAPSDESVGL